jgi:hypothetical protein
MRFPTNNVSQLLDKNCKKKSLQTYILFIIKKLIELFTQL